MGEEVTKNFKMFIERNKRGWTQKDLAERVQTTGNYIAKIENNLANPSYGLAVLIAKQLETDVFTLFPQFEKYK